MGFFRKHLLLANSILKCMRYLYMHHWTYSKNDKNKGVKHLKGHNKTKKENKAISQKDNMAVGKTHTDPLAPNKELMSVSISMIIV